MPISTPRFAILDTATIGFLVAKPTDPIAKGILRAFQSGDWILFLTFHHLEELSSHGESKVVSERFKLLRKLPLVSFLKSPIDPTNASTNIGTIVDLRELEIKHLFDNGTASHNETIQFVRAKALSGLVTGEQFYEQNFDWWTKIYRKYFAAETMLQNTATANLNHFANANAKLPILPEGRFCMLPDEKFALAHFQEEARNLTQRIQERGDCRGINPSAVAGKIMDEAFNDTRKHPGGQVIDFDNLLLKEFGVDRNRIPASATIEDVSLEGEFVLLMKIFARRLLVNKDVLLNAVRKEQLPFWIITREMDKYITKLPKAERGNINDSYIVQFGPYVDLLNVDKRTADALGRAAQHNPLLRRVYDRVPAERGQKGVLKSLNSA